MYGDGAAGLKALFTDVLVAAQKDDRERVHELLASTFMSDQELARVFGPRAAAITPRYHQLMGTVVNRGAVELVAQIYERKYDTVDVIADDYDAAVSAALTTPRPLYSVRIRRAADSKGLRYDCFLYLDGHWRTGNQIGKYLDDAKHD